MSDRLGSRKDLVYTRRVAAQLAEMPLERLRQLEHEGLIQVRVTVSGAQGYSVSDVQVLARLARLRQNLGLDLPPRKAARTLRRELLEMTRRMERMEEAMRQREQELVQEIERLRRRVTRL